MNCKPGDLAVIVRSLANNEGKIVRIVEFAGRVDFQIRGRCVAWVIDPAIHAAQGGMVDVMPDDSLRPIRPGDISDEEVRDLYAPKQKEPA